MRITTETTRQSAKRDVDLLLAKGKKMSRSGFFHPPCQPFVRAAARIRGCVDDIAKTARRGGGEEKPSTAP